MKWVLAGISFAAFVGACVLASAYYEYQDCLRMQTSELMREAINAGTLPRRPEPKDVCDAQPAGGMLRLFSVR